MSVEQVRAAFRNWYARVEQGADLIGALDAASAPGCVVHSQNGDVGDVAIVQAQIRHVRQVYPELTVEIEHLMVTDDHLVAQVTMSGEVTPGLRSPAMSQSTHAAGALVVRVNEAAEIVEIWPYFNPAAHHTFPPRVDPPPPPVPAGSPGSEAQARALAEAWSRSMTAGELIARALPTLAPDALVHATNGDLGGSELLEGQFSIVARAFPDVTITFENELFHDERFVLQFRMAGTHRGPLGPIPATGLRLESIGALVARVDDQGRTMEVWTYLAPGMGLVFPRSGVRPPVHAPGDAPARTDGR